MANTPKIYTKGGDQGQTGLVGGKRVLKSDPRLDVYGTIDELNSVLGLARAQFGTLRTEFEPLFEPIQNQLFNLGSHFATPDPKVRAQMPSVLPEHVSAFEKQIDLWTQELPPLKNFILPAGTSAAAALHMARTICRRAEREAVRLKQTEDVEDISIIYLNRLSDFLFVAARMANFRANLPETIWKK